MMTGLLGGLLALLLTVPAGAPAVSGGSPASSAELAGRVVVIDPGHQLGNHN